MKPYFEDDACTLYLGDSLEVIPTLPDASVDAVVCDPPYAIGFMGKAWDQPGSFVERTPDRSVKFDHVAGNHNPSNSADAARTRRVEGLRFQAWCESWARECLRVLKPGGHLMAFGSPRTYHRLAAGIEDAGFEIRDSIHWIYGSGMPKGVNISKAIDKRREDRPEVLKVAAWLCAARDAAGWTNKQIDEHFGFRGNMANLWTTQGVAAIVPNLDQWSRLRDALGFDDREILPLVEELNARKGEVGEAWARREVIGERAVPVQKSAHLYGTYSGDGRISLSARDEAKRWEGWNTQLRPAHEPIVVARKPTGFNTTVANVLQHGTGALNVDACRTEGVPPSVPQPAFNSPTGHTYGMKAGEGRNGEMSQSTLGRWPTNVVFTHTPGCAQVGERVVAGDKRAGQEPGTRLGGFLDVGSDSGDARPNGRLYGDETVAVFECVPGCPVAELDGQSGVLTSGANPSRRSSPKFGQAYGEFEGDRECTPARGADSGSASRYFPVFRYQAKAPASERPKLADGTQHVSVKPLELMRWLCRLVTPPGGTILDPFAGSGSTLEAAVLEGFRAIGIEREQPYADLCVARLSKPLQPSLFGDLE